MKSQTRYRGSIQKPIQSMENQEEHASFNIKYRKINIQILHVLYTHTL